MRQQQKVEDRLISNKSSDLCNPTDDQVLHFTLIILHYFIYNFLYKWLFVELLWRKRKYS
jgi:hypothetical protein